MILDPVFPPGLIALGATLLVGFGAWRMLRSSGSARREWLLRLAMVALVLVVALRPNVPAEVSGPVATGGLEVYFVVDTTSSMAAEDAPAEVDGRPGTRLDQAKADITGIAGELAGAQFSLTTFDASTVQRVPLTSDATALRSATGAMTQEITYYSSGSSIDAPLEFMAELLGRAAEEHPDRDRVLFYLGDGEQTAASAPASFEQLTPFIDGGAVIGYGTDEGGRMRVWNGYSIDDADAQVAYIRDPVTGLDAISVIDRGNLATIAGQLGLPVAQTGDSELRAIVDAIDVGEVELTEPSLTGAIEFYWIAAIPLALLALRELIGSGIAIAALGRSGAAR